MSGLDTLSRSEVYADISAAMQPAHRPMRAGVRLDLKHWHQHTSKAAEWRSQAARWYGEAARYPAMRSWALETARDCARTARVHLEAAASCRRLMGNYYSISGRA